MAKKNREPKEPPAPERETGQEGPSNVVESSLAEGAGAITQFMEGMYDGRSTVTILSDEEIDILNGADFIGPYYEKMGVDVEPLHNLVANIERRKISKRGIGRNQGFAAVIGKFVDWSKRRAKL